MVLGTVQISTVQTSVPFVAILIVISPPLILPLH